MKKKKGRGNKTTVTFEMRQADSEAEVAVAGDFNEWSMSANPLKKQKDGSWSATVSLAPGTYRYRFVADGKKWLNDPTADRYEPSGLGEDNSVVVVEAM